jgi:hypothetical protein
MKRLTCVIAAGLLASGAWGQSEKPTAGGEAALDAKPVKRSKGARHARRMSTRQVLNLRVSELALDAVPFEQVMDWLADYSGVNVLVRWEALEDVGIERDQPISIKMRNLRLSQVLWVIMNEATAGGPARLAYRTTGNMIVLSTHADLNRAMVVKVYDVRDLLQRVPFHANASFIREQTYVAGLQPRVAAGAVGFQPIIGRAISGVELYTDDEEGDRFEDAQEDDRAEAVRELIDVIVNAVEPDTWAVNGGAGAVREFNGFLIVRNTPYVHQQLAGPLHEDQVTRSP